MDDEFGGHNKQESILHNQRLNLQSLSLKDLREITDDFSDERLLGQGGFGKVYKGVLDNGDTIAVKKITWTMTGLQDKQYENEARHLMRLKHPNIVQLVGYCSETERELVLHNGKYVYAEKSERLLCLEYLPNGSLHKHLSDASSGLDWDTRYKIIRGICYGLHYLHEEWQAGTPIIHMDLKPANILLDDNMVPKIADFGLSRLFGELQTRTMTKNQFGTLGYMSPEYLNRGIITKELDIFSLGVIIIEITTGDKHYPYKVEASSQEFIELVLTNWKNRLEKVQEYTSQEFDCQQIRRCVEIGLLCVKFDQAERPTTRQIIEMLAWGGAECSNKREDENRNTLRYAQGPSDGHAEQIYHGSHFQQVDGESQLNRHDNQDSPADGDPLPGIDGFEIVGEPRLGSTLSACGFSTNGTTLCNFQWVRHLENGIWQSIQGATMYDYVVTADDVGTILAVDCTPKDDNGRKGYFVTEFANSGNKITCDPEMQSHIEACISRGRANFEVFVLQAYSPEEWELATIVLTRPSYQIKCKHTGEVIIDEKYSPSLQTKIPNGRTTQFVLVSSTGANIPFNTQGLSEPDNEDHDVRLRDLIVLVMRTFQKMALDAKRKGNAVDTFGKKYQRRKKKPASTTS